MKIRGENEDMRKGERGGDGETGSENKERKKEGRDLYKGLNSEFSKWEKERV